MQLNLRPNKHFFEYSAARLLPINNFLVTSGIDSDCTVVERWVDFRKLKC